MNRHLASAMLAAGLLLTPALGLADNIDGTVITMNKTGWHLVGQILGNAYVVTMPSDGTVCRFTFLGSGGLDGYYDLFGTSGDDFMGFVQSNATICGYAMTPLIYNGRNITLHGASGNDYIVGGGNEDRWYSWGGPGNDTVYKSANPFSSAWGGDGNDKVFGRDGSADNLYGDAGNDALCNHSGTTAWTFDGGSGTDTRCGSAVTTRSVESVNCSVCGF